MTTSRLVPSERELVALACTGDRSAMAQLIRRHFTPTRRYFARRVACPADVDDLVQRTLIAAIEALPRLRPGIGFAGFVRSIARRLSLRYRIESERAKTRLDVGVCPESLIARDPPAPVSLSRRDAHTRVEHVMHDLPESSAHLLRLRYWDERDATEIAREVRASPAAVRIRLHRARHEMKLALVTTTTNDSDVWPLDDG